MAQAGIYFDDSTILVYDYQEQRSHRDESRRGDMSVESLRNGSGDGVDEQPKDEP